MLAPATRHRTVCILLFAATVVPMRSRWRSRAIAKRRHVMRGAASTSHRRRWVIALRRCGTACLGAHRLAPWTRPGPLPWMHGVDRQPRSLPVARPARFAPDRQHLNGSRRRCDPRGVDRIAQDRQRRRLRRRAAHGHAGAHRQRACRDRRADGSLRRTGIATLMRDAAPRLTAAAIRRGPSGGVGPIDAVCQPSTIRAFRPGF